MSEQRKGGKKCRKFGRAARRPSTGRRKIARLDLYRKARRVLHCNGDVALTAWTDRRYEKGDAPFVLHDAARKARALVAGEASR